MNDIKSIQSFVDRYPEMTNGDVFYFIYSYKGKDASFFLDLSDYLQCNIEDWSKLYCEISLSYYNIKEYFEKH